MEGDVLALAAQAGHFLHLIYDNSRYLTTKRGTVITNLHKTTCRCISLWTMIDL